MNIFPVGDKELIDRPFSMKDIEIIKNSRLICK